MTRSLLDLAQRLLRGELRRARRRKGASPLLIAVLLIAIFGLSRLLEQPETLPAKGAQLDCQVYRVYDGDTVTVDCDRGRVKVRVWGIDAPEMGQEPWGQRARDRLRGLLPDAVRVQVVDTDRYGRAVARLYDGREDLGLAMVRQGQAAVYAQYNDSSAYRQAQSQARRERLGIWSQDGAQQEPWAWRRVNPRG
ncbi:MAG: thermonuclease family protein [Pseudomonadota bacterium]|nr:thermonuclease family protein [Pseudomonadota bacterium]